MITSHSEYGSIRSLYVKPVEAAFIDQETLHNQWEDLNYLSEPIFSKAREEYADFVQNFNLPDLDLLLFEADERVMIDSIYCRDAAIATDFGMIICNMGKGARLKEPAAQKAAFEKANIPVLGEIKAPGTIEGGDVAWLDPTTLAVGHTYRTNLSGIRQLKALLEPHGITVIVAEMPHYKGKTDVFHLMSVLSPVDKDLAVVYSPLMPIRFRNELLDRGFGLVEVPDEEFESMGCNVLATAPRKCLMVKGNPITEGRMISAGCEVHTYPGEHISVKGGGGPTCLTRPIKRAL